MSDEQEPGPKKKSKKKKIEWVFEPTLGYEIESTLTKEEFEKLLIRISVPKEEEADPEKKGTWALHRSDGCNEKHVRLDSHADTCCLRGDAYL